MRKFLLLSLVSIAAAAGFFMFSRKASAQIVYCDLTVTVRDHSGAFVQNVTVNALTQGVDADGNPTPGAAVLSGDTANLGYVTLKNLICANTYAIKIFQYNATYGYTIRYNVLGTDGSLTMTLGQLYIITRDGAGDLVRNQSFSVYTQKIDADGNPIIDQLVVTYTSGSEGGKIVYLGPGTYWVRMTGSDPNKPYDLPNQVVTAGQQTLLDYKLSTLRIIVEDPEKKLLKNVTMSIYKQEFDVRGNPIYGSISVASATTGDTGKVDAFLPAGTYAIKINGTYSFYSVWRQTVKDQSITTQTYPLSALRVILRDANGQAQRNTAFYVTSQKLDVDRKPIEDQILYATTTSDTGFADVYLPKGTYAIVAGTIKVYSINLQERQLTTLDYPRSLSWRPYSELHVIVPYGNTTVATGRTIRTSLPKVRARDQKRIVSDGYRIQSSRFRRGVTVTLTGSSSFMTANKVNTRKVRLAYYDSRAKTWKIIGRPIGGLQYRAGITSSRTIALIELK